LVEWEQGNLTLALRRTEELLRMPHIPAIYEATFKFDNVLIRVDVLQRVSPNVWRLIEVKASTRTKDVHLDDLAIQTYVLLGCGLQIDSMRLMHLNRAYVYPGGLLELTGLFAQMDVSTQVCDRLPEIGARLSSMKAMLREPTPPDRAPGDHCHTPYRCPFWNHCTDQKPARWIYFLPGPRRAINKLVAHGIDTIDDIPEGTKLSDTQQRVKHNVEWIGPGLKDALESVRYPVHHLDFEGFMPAVPLFPGTRPYQTLPFQWSNHILREDGVLKHEHYLSVDSRDLRPELAWALLESLGREGSICVYSGYEWRILMDLAEAVPRFRRELCAVTLRLWDLLPIVRRHYYHPGFEGSYSIKAIAPALVPSLAYGDLTISDGAVAALQYHRAAFGEVEAGEKASIRNSLLEYCKRDTLALVEVRRILHGKALAMEDGSLREGVVMPGACRT
jgi:hypothetical protein